MTDSVKFIFMTLIKVPCIIFAAFFVFNIFAFFFIYFKMLGFSYVVMQEVVENNYINGSQLNQLNAQFAAIDDIPLAENTNIIVGLSPSVDSTGKNIPACYNKATGSIVLTTNMGAGTTVFGDSALTKTQYGRQKTIGVHCDYTIVWPLSHNNAMQTSGTGGTGVSGMTGGAYNPIQTTYNGDAFEDNMDASAGDITDRGHAVTIPLDIYYTVPGLKYYADK